MARDRRDIVEMLRRENELLKARIQKLETRLTRHRQAFRALDQMDETMQAMRCSCDVRQAD